MQWEGKIINKTTGREVFVCLAHGATRNAAKADTYAKYRRSARRRHNDKGGTLSIRAERIR